MLLILSAAKADYTPQDSFPPCCLELNATLQEQNKILLQFLNKKDTCKAQTLIYQNYCCETKIDKKDLPNHWWDLVILFCKIVLFPVIGSLITKWFAKDKKVNYALLVGIFVLGGVLWSLADGFAQYSSSSESKRGDSDALVAIIALVGTLIAAFIAAYISWKNTIKTLEATRQTEAEKRDLEKQYNSKQFLKENVAKFINKSTILNGRLTEIIYKDLEEGNENLAKDEYEKTFNIRVELKEIYYSIKVSLDGSQKQKELEKILDEYMKVTCFDFNLDQTRSEMYTQPLAKLYHKARAIVHENYEEPK